ncbi:helix-turn-helix domain-containing protein [Clostridium botulinum]|nr:helix-turn-helix domain-containing protein [Clostridium botulinum]
MEKDNYKNGLENSTKVNEVSKLLEEGHTVEEICEILNIGKGEVILIKELYSK